MRIAQRQERELPVHFRIERYVEQAGLRFQLPFVLPHEAVSYQIQRQALLAFALQLMS